jgi:hypothetical protein
LMKPMKDRNSFSFFGAGHSLITLIFSSLIFTPAEWTNMENGRSFRRPRRPQHSPARLEATYWHIPSQRPNQYAKSRIPLKINFAVAPCTPKYRGLSDLRTSKNRIGSQTTEVRAATS